MSTKAIDFEKIAKLANLRVSDADKQILLPKFEKIIEYVGKVQELEFDQSQENSLAINPKELFRQDKSKKEVIDIFTLSEFVEDNFFIVPNVIKEK